MRSSGAGIFGKKLMVKALMSDKGDEIGGDEE